MNFVVLKTQIRKTKANVLWIENGYDAVQFVKNGNNADLILMDINLGRGIDGTQAAENFLFNIYYLFS